MKKKLMQKLAGLVLIACGMVPAFMDGDCGAAALLVPFGLYLMFTKTTWLH